jgi:hypothetical protein
VGLRPVLIPPDRQSPQHPKNRDASEDSLCVRRIEPYSLGFFGRMRLFRTHAASSDACGFFGRTRLLRTAGGDGAGGECERGERVVPVTVEPWLSEWCSRELGGSPVEELLSASLMSDVRAFRLDDGREVVIKSRLDPTGRVPSCLAVQRAVTDAGLPCPRPLTQLTMVDGLAVHAEEWLPGGEVARGNYVASAERSARLYAAVTAVTRRLELPPPLPNPEWVHWDHAGPGHWPPNALHDNRPGADSLPPDLLDIAARTRQRLLAATSLPRVLGHADWEAQNLRWRPTVIHDWDSIAWLPEPALVGAAAGAFASIETPTLAPLESSQAFLTTYQEEAGAFTGEELEVAWAASLWPALHNARAEILWDHPPVALTALLEQAGTRLNRAAA